MFVNPSDEKMINNGIITAIPGISLIKKINTATIQKNLSRSLSPKPNYWSVLEKIANRSYVPETEESRLKGAGAENDSD